MRQFTYDDNIIFIWKFIFTFLNNLPPKQTKLLHCTRTPGCPLFIIMIIAPMQHNNNRRCYQQSTTIAIACGYVLQADKKRGKNVMIFIASNMNEKFIKLTQLMTVRMQLIFFLLGIFNHPCENHFQLLNIQQLQKSAS